MGRGISETFALGGYKVSVYEVYEPTRNSVMSTMEKEMNFMAAEDLIKKEDVQNALARISIFSNLEDAAKDADYVIEAVSENIDVKKELFNALHEICNTNCIFASNTSSLSLSEMIADLPEERKAKCMTCHWYNPAHLMPIVEMSFFGNMSEEDYSAVAEIYRKADKQTVRVRKDVPGMVANRIQQAIAREVYWLLENEVADPEDIDKALKFGPAFRFATTGALEVIDMGGLDIWCAVGDNLLAVMDNRTQCSDIVRLKLAEGKLGIKSGEGFFKYPADKVDGIRENFQRKLMIQLKASKNYIE